LTNIKWLKQMVSGAKAFSLGTSFDIHGCGF